MVGGTNDIPLQHPPLHNSLFQLARQLIMVRHPPRRILIRRNRRLRLLRPSSGLRHLCELAARKLRP